MPIAYFPDKILELGQRQVEMLVAKKLLTPKGNHEFWGDSSEAALTAMIESPETMVCDFCKETPVVKEYMCRDFLAMDTPDESLESIGSWFACSLCAERIDLDDQPGLSARAIENYQEQHPGQLDGVGPIIAVELALTGVHKSFMEHRVGPGRRI